MKNLNAQGALEYLLIIGGAITVAGILIALFATTSNTMTDVQQDEKINFFCSVLSGEQCGSTIPSAGCVVGDCTLSPVTGKCTGQPRMQRTTGCFGGTKTLSEQTCAEMQGTICSASQTCSESTVEAADTADCCLAMCVENVLCGNRTIDNGEACDPPGSINPVTCKTTIGEYDGTQTCNDTCTGWNTCTSTEYCGDNEINGTEQCDGTDWGTIQTCSDLLQGTTGTLSCNQNNCTFDTSQCVQNQGILSVSPAGGLSSSGTVGGPFSPSSLQYTLNNMGTAGIAWTATKTQPWITLSSAGGNLAVGANATVTVSINTTEANLLAAGSYSDTINFINTTNGQGDTARSARLTVNSMGVQPMLTASRTSGVAPVGVFFDAINESDWVSGVIQPKGFASQPAQITGVKITTVSYSNSEGQGTLAFDAAAKTLSWNSGTAVNVSSGENFILQSPTESPTGAKLYVWVNPAQLPSSNANESITIVSGGINADWASFHYEWDFGDPAPGGTSSIDPLWYWQNGAKKSDGSWYAKNKAFGWNAAHVYENAGTYPVKLKIIDDEGTTREYSQTITVAAQPAAGWTIYYVSSSDGNDPYYSGLCENGADYASLVQPNSVDAGTITQGYVFSIFTLKDGSGNIIGYMRPNGWANALGRGVYSDTGFVRQIGQTNSYPRIYDSYPGFNLDAGITETTVYGLGYTRTGGTLTTGNVLYAENPVLINDTVIQGSTVKNSIVIHSEIKNAYVENAIVVNSKIYAANSSATKGTVTSPKTINSKGIHEALNTICGPLASWAAGTAKAKPNSKILFKRGEEFSAMHTMSGTFNEPLYVGAYGTGNKPVLYQSQNYLITAGNLNDLRVLDLEVRGTPAEDNMAFQYLGDGSLMLRVKESLTGQNNGWHPLAFVVDSEFDKVNGHTIFHGAVEGTMKRMAILGSNFYGPQENNGEWLNRLYSGKTVVEHNSYSQQISIKGMLRLMTNRWKIAAFNYFSDPGSNQTINLEGDPLNTGPPKHILIMGNVFNVDAGTKYMKAINNTQGDNVTITNNRMYSTNIESTFASITSGNDTPDSYSIRVLNNSVYYGGATNYFGFANSSNIIATTWNIVVANNAFSAPQTSNISTYGLSISSQSAKVYSNYNLWHIPNVAKPFASGGTLTPAEWRALGHDSLTTSVWQSPQFVNPASGDLRLNSSSPAKDKGTSEFLAWNRIDADGKYRTDGKPDIGALESP